MAELILHPDTALRLNSLRNSPPQSLLLHGEKGVGLMTIAREITGKAPIVVVPEGESQTLSIKIERIRQLYDETRGAATDRQFVIVDDADTMTRDAQSAFLKLLEEPNSQTHFILTSHDKDRLLPTIVSRVQVYYLPLPTERDVGRYTDAMISDQDVRRKVAFLAPRHPSLVHCYVSDAEVFGKDVELMSDARRCITAEAGYDKQVIALRYNSNRQLALQFVDACITLLHFSLRQDANGKIIALVDRYLSARDALLSNANVKLTLAQLMVQ